MEQDNKDRLIALSVFLVLFFIVFSYMYPSLSRRSMTDKEIFTDIYNRGDWGGRNGVNIGSTAEDGAKSFIDYLQNFLDTHPDVTSIVDMGCGYGEMLKNLHLSKNTYYLGLDLVDQVVAFNQRYYSKPNVAYASVNGIEDLQKYEGDLLILKDVLQHWNSKQIIYTRDHIIPHFKYAIIVSDVRTVFSRHPNTEIRTGKSRSLDLAVSPFFMTPKETKDYLVPPYRVKRLYLFENEPITPQAEPILPLNDDLPLQTDTSADATTIQTDVVAPVQVDATPVQAATSHESITDKVDTVTEERPVLEQQSLEKEKNIAVNGTK